MSRKRNNDTTIGIVGYGMVGTAIHNGLKDIATFKVFDIDDNKRTHTLLDTIKSDFVFMCLPTPMKKETGEIDISILDMYLSSARKNSSAIYIIKSTIVPGSTKKLQRKYPNLHIVYNPEFLRAKTHLEDFVNTDRIILGGEEEDCLKVEKLYRKVFKDTNIFTTDTTTAEMVKYTANAFLSTKLAFFNEIYDVCKMLRIDYVDMVRMVVADSRIGDSHYTVPGEDGLRGFGGLCFPKDLNSLMYKIREMHMEPIIMDAVWKKNLEVRKVKDWETISGAVS